MATIGKPDGLKTWSRQYKKYKNRDSWNKIFYWEPCSIYRRERDSKHWQTFWGKPWSSSYRQGILPYPWSMLVLSFFCNTTRQWPSFTMWQWARQQNFIQKIWHHKRKPKGPSMWKKPNLSLLNFFLGFFSPSNLDFFFWKKKPNLQIFEFVFFFFRKKPNLNLFFFLKKIQIGRRKKNKKKI